MHRITTYTARAKWIVGISAVVVLTNFFAFIWHSHRLGGDAINGYARAGHYFVCAHGTCTEVSDVTWHRSYQHALSAIAGHLLILGEILLLIRSRDIVVSRR